MKNLILILGFLFLLTACNKDKDDETNSIYCSPAYIDGNLYLNAESEPFTIVNTDLSPEGCFIITASYGGGCTDVFANLVSSTILETQPPQRNIRFVFTDIDQCEAGITQDFYFNIEKLKVEGSNQVLLNLQDFDTPFLYEY